MIKISRSLCVTALLALASALAAGCGMGGAPMQPRIGRMPMVRAMDDPGATSEAAPAPNAGDFRPLPTVTPTPPAPKPGPGNQGNADVNNFYSIMQNFGYAGSLQQLVGSVEAVTHVPYVSGWDPNVDPAARYAIWQPTMQDPTVGQSFNDYKSSAVSLANYRLQVIYYVWVSRPASSGLNGAAPPPINFNQNIPIVKGIQNDTNWLVQISPQGTVLDFLEMPQGYDQDLNHLIPIPQELY